MLTDFSQYPQWNPYLIRVDGKFLPGETVAYTLVDGNFEQPLKGTARIEVIEAYEQFYWVGKLLMPGIFDTRHVFQLVPQGDGSTQLLHFEEFRGLLAVLLPDREKRATHTRHAFDSMNQALQLRLAGQ
jgi:hypothetical protein